MVSFNYGSSLYFSIPSSVWSRFNFVYHIEYRSMFSNATKLTEKGKRFEICNKIFCIIILHNNLKSACSIGDIGKASVLHNNQWRKLHHIASIAYLLQLLLILIMQVRSFLLLELSIWDCKGVFCSTRNGKFYKVCRCSVAHQLL